MAELVDLKRSPEDKKENKEQIESFGEETYAWGTRMHLDEIEANKLGIMDLNVGDEVEIGAMAKVIGKASREGANQNPDGHIEIQITQMAVQKPEGKTSAAERLYGGDDNDSNES